MNILCVELREDRDPYIVRSDHFDLSISNRLREEVLPTSKPISGVYCKLQRRYLRIHLLVEEQVRLEV